MQDNYMEDRYDPTAYGSTVAQDYDELYQDVLETDSAVACVAELAGGGAVLELGIGTGRLALPLIREGIEVHGVDASEEMVEGLRAKPGGPDVPVVMGDFAEVEVPGAFSVVLLAFNTIFALPDQEAQVRCFANAAAHLQQGGHFVIEAEVPDLMQFSHGPSIRPRPVGGQWVALVMAEHDQVRQRIETKQIRIGSSGVRLHPVNHRYAWPAELDLMARLAGLRLSHRWGGWDRSPFAGGSTTHVSVYELPQDEERAAAALKRPSAE